MGQKNTKENDNTSLPSGRTEMRKQRYVSNTTSRASSTGEVTDRTPSRALYRNQAGTRISFQVSKLVDKINQIRSPTKRTLYDQRFREDMKGLVTNLEASNPRFKRSESVSSLQSLTKRINRLSSRLFKRNDDLEAAMPPRRKKSQRTQISRNSRTMTDMPLTDPSTFQDLKKAKTFNAGDRQSTKSVKLLIKSSKTTIPNVHSPKPPLGKKIKLPYATNVTDSPFENFNNPKDYRCFRFSSLSLTKVEQRKVAVEMILCSINEDVIKMDKLDFHKSSVKKTMRGISKYVHRSLRKGNSQTSSGHVTPGRKSKPFRNRIELEPAGFIKADVRQAVVEFVDLVAANYTQTNYHSFAHAVDVTQMMFMLLYFLQEKLSRKEPFILLTACLCHDIGHFGANNKFLSEVTLTNNLFLNKFGRESLLEKFHCFLFKKVANESRLFSTEFMETNVALNNIETSIELILATDMERHDHYCGRVRKEIDLQKQRVGENTIQEEDKFQIPMTFLALCIKLCDVVNVSREFEDAKKWAVILSQEFQAMGRLFDDKKASKQTEHFLRETNNQIFEDEDKFDICHPNKVFQVSDNLTSKCLIDFQGKCDLPHFADCSQMTLNFIKATAVPMAILLNEINSSACWFLLKRMNLNQESWTVAITEADKKEGNVNINDQSMTLSKLEMDDTDEIN